MSNNNELANVLSEINGTPAPVVNGAIKAIQTDEQSMLMAELQRLRSENEALRKAKSASQGPVTFKVSEKGCISVFGVSKPMFAPTLYVEAWERILDNADRLRAFIKANNKSLVRKS